jgi:hypothetical protein
MRHVSKIEDEDRHEETKVRQGRFKQVQCLYKVCRSDEHPTVLTASLVSWERHRLRAPSCRLPHLVV